jgi:tRNA(Ile)-lysidine synthase
VVTGHTANDRAETLLLHLARGSHRQGLASLRRRRPLSAGSPITLVRPLLGLGRASTGQFCVDWNLPIWLDSSNASRRFSRNRIRQEVLPVLEELHPGCASRISALAERLEREQAGLEELLDLALLQLHPNSAGEPLLGSVPATANPSGDTANRAQTGADGPNARSTPALDRVALTRLGRANQGQLLHHWLKRHSGISLEAASLEALLVQLQPREGPGERLLGQGWRLQWTRPRLLLVPPGTGPGPDEPRA